VIAVEGVVVCLEICVDFCSYSWILELQNSLHADEVNPSILAIDKHFGVRQPALVASSNYV
jgi:hypothetical protein